jgi:hypothetical protein
MNKVHGNTGNKNALQGQDAKSSHLHIRCTQSAKAGWVRAANRDKLKLAEWVTRELNRAAE